MEIFAFSSEADELLQEIDRYILYIIEDITVGAYQGVINNRLLAILLKSNDFLLKLGVEATHELWV